MNATQRKNGLAAIEFLRNNVTPAKFNGNIFAKSSATKPQCLISHLWHNGKLPSEIHFYMSAGNFIAADFDESNVNLAMLFDKHYGKGSLKLFGSIASNSTHAKFLKAMESFYGMEPQTIEYSVTASSGKKAYFDTLEQARDAVGTLKLFGVDATIHKVIEEEVK